MANASYLRLVGREDIVGKTVEDALPEVVAQGFIATLDRVYESGQAYIGRREPVLLDGDHDVFGDGTVVIKSAPGHTPGHQVLFVDLAETGPLVLSGDLYHFPENRTLKRVPTFNFDEAQTLASMDAVEDFLFESGGTLWIEHDSAANALLNKSPAYYE